MWLHNHKVSLSVFLTISLLFSGTTSQEFDDEIEQDESNATAKVKHTIFTAVSPKLVRANTPYNIFVNVEAGPEASPSTFTASLGLVDEKEKEPFISSQQIQIAPGSSGLVSIPIKELPEDSNSFKLTLRGFHLNDESKFEESTTIFKDTKVRSLLLQTDKPIYKPGETVQFRVVQLNRFLRPLQNKTVELTIVDPQQNIIKQWKEAKLNSKGLLSSSLELSSEPNLGDWTIRVLDFTGQTETISFAVDQYVLPKFKVDVKLPSFLTYNNSKMMVEIAAAYTYGKPISGSVEVKLSEYYQYRYHGQEVKSILRKLPIESTGSAFVEFDIVKELLNTKEERFNRYEREFIVEATVTDGLTGRTQNGSSRVKIYENPYKVELVKQPTNYKPGFPLTLLFKITTQDGTPVSDDSPQALKIAHGYTFNEEDGILYYPIPSNGIVKVTLQMPTNQLMCSSTIEVTYKGVVHTIYPPQKLNSPSRTYMEVSLLTETPKIGELMEVHVKLNKPFDGLNYLVYGRGEVLTSSHVATNGEVKDFNFSIPIVNGVAPEATVLVWTIIKPTNEVAVDSKRFTIETILDNHLKVTLSKASAEPGENIDLSLDTESGSLVALRGIDQSVTLLKEDKDITVKTIEDEIKSFQHQLNNYRIWGGSNAFQIFEEAGVIILTNGVMEKEHYFHPRPYYARSGGGFGGRMYKSAVMMEAAPMALAADNLGGQANAIGGAQEIRVRTNFPETWLWEEIETNNSITTLSKSVPDTLTSWLITGFSLNTNTGIGVTVTPSVLETFRPFFVTLNVPYSIVKGETFGLQVLVHNYMKSPISADISLQNNHAEYIFNDEANQTSTISTKTIQLEPISVQLVTFTITPVKFGVIKLDVKGVSAIAGDAISQPLIVKPPGQKYTQTRAALLDLRSVRSAKYSIEAEFPEKRVQGADVVKLTVVADLLGTTISNLDKLLQMPVGCGEQNMLNFVPDVVILEYLTITGSLTPEIKAKATRFLETGYQRELSYKHSDGSYSAFGNSDAHGSTWLTAFVIRSFISAKPWITIDDTVLIQGLTFLARKQHEDGSFIELGRVLHSDMQGGSGGTLALSAYVLMAFIESKSLNLPPPPPASPGRDGKSGAINFDEVIAKGLNYIIRSYDVSKEDPYTMNLITYALSVVGQPEKEKFLSRLEELATKESDLVHWQPPKNKNASEESKDDGNKILYYHGPRSTKPISVEMSSYGLMTYLLRNDLDKALAIAKWLLQQRNSEGGFISTQDTVVGLTAIAKFAMATRSSVNNLSVEAKYEGGSDKFNVNNENAIVLQEAFLPEATRNVGLDVNGEGTALASLTWSYYVEEKMAEPSFTINAKVETKSPKAETIQLTISTSFLRPNKPSNMAIMEINLPSGYVFDSDELPDLRKIEKVMRYELEDGGTKLQIYFDSLHTEASTVKVTANRLFKVKNAAKAYIMVYDYYDTTLRATEFYEPPSSSGSDCASENDVCA